jgi:hypothetical protein
MWPATTWEDVCLKSNLIVWCFYYWLEAAKHDVFTSILYYCSYKFECLVTEYRIEKVCPFQCVQLLLWICWNLFSYHDLCKWLIDFLWFWLWTFQAICCTPEILWITRQLYPTWKYFEGDLVLLQRFISFLHSHSYHACWTFSHLLQKLLAELLRKLDADLKHEICHWAAHYVSKQFKTLFHC